MKVVESCAYFDHAAVAPISTPARLAMSEYLQQVENQGDIEWREWAKGVEIGRKRAAQLIDCTPDEIAFIPNTTYGINVIANGVPWQPGDNLVVPDNEFPSNLLPWKLLVRRGVEVRIVPTNGQLDIDRLLEFVDSRTRIVTASWVHYATGYRLDLAELCARVQARGAKLFVDAIQGLGAFPLSIRDVPIDFLAADGHKWMLGPEGAGILFVRKGHLDWLEPIMMGWGSVSQAHDFSPEQSELKKQASRYEGGSANMVGVLGFAASIGVLLEAGCHRASSGMADTILQTSGRLEDGLKAMGAHVFRHSNIDRQSGILSFELPNQDSHQVRQRLLNEKIVISVRHGRLRAAVHAYNIDDEVSRMLSTLSDI
jgi:selenocysteine lyase/cysteine desulfurase